MNRTIMAETRCANPEYQVDVDVMMIDYALYHAIDAKLRSLKVSLTGNRSEREAANETADSLVRNFDSKLTGSQ